MTNEVERAKAIAYAAHECQVDKAGFPYIKHVARVAAAVSDDPVAEAVAWLHDVVEDNPSIGYSRRGDVSDYVWGCVYMLTRLSGQTDEDYYRLIRCSELATRVKLADIADNSDEARLALLDGKTADRLRRKYAKARKMLGVDA